MMITYVYAIDIYNSIQIEDGKMYSVSNNVKTIQACGFDLKHKSFDRKEQEKAYEELEKILAARNFHLYHRRQKEYGEDSGILSI